MMSKQKRVKKLATIQDKPFEIHSNYIVIFITIKILYSKQLNHII